MIQQLISLKQLKHSENKQNSVGFVVGSTMYEIYKASSMKTINIKEHSVVDLLEALVEFEAFQCWIIGSAPEN